VTDLLQNLKTHVETLASAIGERNHRNYLALEDAASYIEGAFRAVGCEPRRHEYTARDKLFRNIQAEFGPDDPGDGILVIGAHYDTDAGSPGANDNATGTAALIEIARALQSAKVEQRVRLVAFVNEERPFLRTPLMGSYVYAKACRTNGDRIDGMISLETIGSKSEKQRLSLGGLILPRRGDFIAVVGNRRSRQFVLLCDRMLRRRGSVRVESRSLPGFTLGVKSSDHWSFWKHGIPAVMITDTAPLRYSHYHRATDTPDKICYPFFRDVVEALQDLALQAAVGSATLTASSQSWSTVNGSRWKSPIYAGLILSVVFAAAAFVRRHK
jgi:Zn-dependent M28 family amino/carboxypeptidase